MTISEKKAIIILPYPIPAHKLGQAAMERIRLGDYTLDVNLPPVRIGQRVMLRRAGKYIDSSLAESDLQLLISSEQAHWGNLRRDVQIELPICTGNSEFIKKTTKKRLNISGKTFDVTIPHGVKPGQLLRLKGAGEICNGGYQGDILLKLASVERNFWTMWGFLSDNVALTDFKLQIRFKVPFLAEIDGEFNFRKQDFSVG